MFLFPAHLVVPSYVHDPRLVGDRLKGRRSYDGVVAMRIVVKFDDTINIIAT